MSELENKEKTNQNENEPVHAEAVQVESAENGGSEPHNDPHFSLRSLRAEAEIYAITRTLEYTGWNRRRAAQLLSISYRGILYKIRQHNLTPSSVRPAQPMVEAVKVD